MRYNGTRLILWSPQANIFLAAIQIKFAASMDNKYVHGIIWSKYGIQVPRASDRHTAAFFLYSPCRAMIVVYPLLNLQHLQDIRKNCSIKGMVQATLNH